LDLPQRLNPASRQFTNASDRNALFPFSTRDFPVILWQWEGERKRGGGHGDPSCARRAPAGPPVPPFRLHSQRRSGDLAEAAYSHVPFPLIFFEKLVH
jgi:hypothetical protein